MTDIKTTIGLKEDFVQYFRNNGHKFLKPSKCFTDDPTLFFTTAGMVQLKPIFLGLKEFDENYSKLVNSQISIRVGGKCNDLDDVGLDTYHLTSFNMLGNWSLNNYWKEEAIQLAYNYLIKIGLDRNKMYATYFEGTSEIPEDTESRDIWSKFLDPSHVIKGSKKDNFWSLGSGPCGPCTELHYDITNINKNASNLVNHDDPTVIELWNIVLMQYDEIVTPELTKYEPLTKRFVDTGAGLERLAMVIQNKTSIYQTDVFKKLIKYVEIVSADKEYTDKYGDQDDGKDKAFRIFSDHIRTLVIALYDGARFDCNGRGFILRKVIKRLLVNYYIYLNNCVVKPLMTHHIIEGLISECLVFNMFYKHDTKEIKKLMVDEETMFIGKLNKFKMLYNSKCKKATNYQVKAKLLEDVVKLKESHGVDKEIIDVIDRLVIA
jgi:alanyl-tRNA synthetase